MASFGERLKELRKKSGYTQAEAAEALGIPRGSYANYETSNRAPSRDVIIKISELFCVSTDYLLGTTPAFITENSGLSEQTQILLQTLKGASEKEIAQAIKIVEALKGTMPDD